MCFDVLADIIFSEARMMHKKTTLIHTKIQTYNYGSLPDKIQQKHTLGREQV